MSGWYAVKRGITSHHLFKGKPDRLAVWMWLLDNVAYTATTHDVKGNTVDVPRGSVCASERHIARECGVGYQVVRTAIKRFSSEHMLNATPTHGKNLITLCNYEKYQDPKKEDNAEVNATPTQHQRNPNAQKKQGNKETTSSLAAAEYQDYLKAHPKAVESAKGEAAFSALLADGVDARQIIAAATGYADHVKDWSAEAKVQQSDNFLSGEYGKWRDYIPKPKAAPPTRQQILQAKADAINGDGFIPASFVTPSQARQLIDAGLVTQEQMSKQGIAA